MDSYQKALQDQLLGIETLLLKKHHDYGADNLIKFGEYGILVRTSDKLERLINLVSLEEGEVDDETKLDTWRDQAGYAVQALLFLTDQLGLPVEPEARLSDAVALPYWNNAGFPYRPEEDLEEFSGIHNHP